MSEPDPTPASTAPRRPPRPPARWASVTYLGLGPCRQAQPVPVAPVDGNLALKSEAAPTPGRAPHRGRPQAPAPPRPRTPELRLVQGEDRAVDDVTAWAARFAQGVVEVLGGDRPLTQLVRWTSRRVYADLERRVRILGRTCDTDQRLRTVRPQVRSVHVCHPAEGAAEVSVHVRHGKRSRALAARLELVQGRWQCTALQLG